MIVLGETNYENGQPTLQYCKSYAQQHGVPLDKIYIDYGNEYFAWETLFSNINPYIPDSGQFSLPWDCVLDGDNMEYIYSTLVGPHPDVNTALNQALND